MAKRKTTTKQKLLRDNPDMQWFIKECYEKPVNALIMFNDLIIKRNDNIGLLNKEGGQVVRISEILPLIKNKEFNKDLRSKMKDEDIDEELERVAEQLTSQGFSKYKISERLLLLRLWLTGEV